jgi:hypothetical protein
VSAWATAAHPSSGGISRPSDDITVFLSLPLNHLSHMSWVVTHVSIHEEDKLSSAFLQTIHVSRAQTELARAREDLDLL